jgi:hypothetical protein
MIADEPNREAGLRTVLIALACIALISCGKPKHQEQTAPPAQELAAKEQVRAPAADAMQPAAKGGVPNAGDRFAEAVVTHFYQALALGDGNAAATYVVPEKRAAGPLSAAELGKSFAGLKTPVRQIDVGEIDGDLVEAHYAFTTADGAKCAAITRVKLEERSGRPLITEIKTVRGC